MKFPAPFSENKPRLLLLSLPFCIWIAGHIAWRYANDNEPVWWGIPIYCVGLGFFLVAKWSVIKKGKLITFGVEKLEGKFSAFYTIGFILMLFGYMFSFDWWRKFL